MKQVRPHLVVFCVLAAVLLTGAHDTLRNGLTDLRFRLLPRPATGEVVLAAIDAPSLEKVGVWPWSRRVYAEIVDKLVAAGASEIVLDVDFSTQSDPASDKALADALHKAGGSIILPSFQQTARGQEGPAVHVNRPLPVFAKNAWPALVNVPVERDGLVRRYSFGEAIGGEFLPSVAGLLAGTYETSQGSFLIDYGLKAETVPVVSVSDVLSGDPAVLKGIASRKVVVGGTALELGDRFNVPNGRVISGALLQILATESIRQGRALRATSDFVTWNAVAALVVLMTILATRRFYWRLIPLLGAMAVVEGVAIVLQAKHPFVLDTSLFHVAAVVYLVAIAFDEIELRGLWGKVAERRFQLIASLLGDGLVCADRQGKITLWNRGAAAIFGYPAREMIGEPLDKISAAPFSILDLPHEALREPGGKVVELEGRRKDGSTFPLEACFSGWQGSEDFQFAAILRDISGRKREIERIRFLAEYDTLTGLANRNTLHERLAQRFADAQSDESELALLIVGLDKFKEINDTHGAACGDEVLCAVARRLRGLVENGGVVARLGGDEFAILINGINLVERAQTLCERITTALSKIGLSGGARHLRITCGVGIAIYPKDCQSADELLSNADLALDRAKAGGCGKALFFDRAFRREFEARLSLEAELERALEENEFELYYQPQVDLADGRLVGAEALIRWRHPQRGIRVPADFITVLNACSVSDAAALWVMETACRQGALWQQKGRGIRIAVNLSPSQLRSDEFVPNLRTVLRKTGFLPALLELEITENILLSDDERMLEIFHEIQHLGVNVAFDDYGTGYASLSYLKKFAFDRLKIDRSFVQELQEGSDDAAIVASTIGLSKMLGLTVIAEGIEDRATLELLRRMGCQEGQGFYFSTPIPAAEFEDKYLSDDAPALLFAPEPLAASAA